MDMRPGRASEQILVSAGGDRHKPTYVIQSEFAEAERRACIGRRLLKTVQVRIERQNRRRRGCAEKTGADKWNNSPSERQALCQRVYSHNRTDPFLIPQPGTPPRKWNRSPFIYPLLQWEVNQKQG